MALRERTIVEQRMSAIELLASGVSVREIAARLGVSRQAVYDWKERYRLDGAKGLNDRSRRPHHSPSRTAEWIERRLIEERNKWGFGSKKILRRLQDAEPEVSWPPRSTVDAVFKRSGLVRERRRSRRLFAPVAAHRTYVAEVPGQVMTVDFKGHFRLGNGQYCYPLTIADPVSRYLLACDGFARISLEQTWASFARVFREYGLPRVMHSDNGVPFGTAGKGRFSTLGVRLMKYGIQPVYSRPGHPEDNGAHERMHRTLKEHTAVQPERTIEEQQVRFEMFRRMFNEERPHEGLGFDRPARRHRSSPTSFPLIEPVIEYEPHFESRIVTQHGVVSWKGQQIFLSQAFARERVGFEPIDYSTWRVHYGSFVIGSFDERTTRFI
jgi:putative transposase